MSGFTGGGKIQMARIYAIWEAVKDGGYPNCSTLAESQGVTQKTIQRDVTYMRDQLGIPMEYNASLHGYELTGVVDSFPVFEMQVEDLAALFLSHHAMGAVKGTKLAEVLSPAFDKLTKRLEGKVSMKWGDFDRAFSVKSPGLVNMDLTVFGKLTEAVLNEQVVSFTYRKGVDSTSKRRRIQPYHVSEVDGRWYVVGFDENKEGLRTFALQRIKGLKVLKSTFSRPEDFQADEYVGGSIGIWNSEGRKKTEVLIEVSGWVAREVQERTWHPSQRVKVLDDLGNYVELRMNLASFKELTGLVLSWGSNAKVIAPKGFRVAVKKEVDAMAKRYREDA